MLHSIRSDSKDALFIQEASMEDYTAHLPKDVMLHLFSFLQFPDLTHCCMVSKRWRELGDFVLKQKIEAIAFGQSKWKRFFGEVGEVPPLSPDVGKTLCKPCPFWQEKRVYETHQFVLIPRTVEGKPFDLAKLMEWVEQKGFLILSLLDGFEYNFGGPLSQSKWVLITKDPVPGTTELLDYWEHEIPITQQTGYEIPRLFELATVVAIRLICGEDKSENGLLLRCKEQWFSDAFSIEIERRPEGKRLLFLRNYLSYYTEFKQCGSLAIRPLEPEPSLISKICCIL